MPVSSSRLIHRISLLVLLVLCAQLTRAQAPSLSFLMAKDFPIQEVWKQFESYDIETDSLGRAYFCSNNGARRFNGTKIVPIRVHPDIGMAIFSQMWKDMHGDIWIMAVKRGLSRFTQDSLLPYRHNDSIPDRLRRHLENFHVDSDRVIHFAPRGLGYFTLSPEGELTEVVGQSSGIHGFVITYLPDGRPFQFSILQRKDERPHYNLSLDFLHPNGELTRLGMASTPRPLYDSQFLVHKNGEWTLGIGTRELFRGRNDSILARHTLPAPSLGLFEDSQHDIWIGTFGKGIFRARQGNLNQLDQFLDGARAAVTAEDDNGGLWIKSNVHKFAYLPNRHLYRYAVEYGHFQSNELSWLLTDYEKIYALTRGDPITILEGDSVRTIPDPDYSKEKFQQWFKYSQPTGMFADSATGLFWASNPRLAAIWDGTRWSTVWLDTANVKGHRAINLLPQPDSSLLIGTNRDLMFVKGNQLIDNVPLEYKVFDLRKLAQEPDGTLWMGGKTGVWILDGDSARRPLVRGEHATALHDRIYNIGWFADRMWVQTLDLGLFTIQEDQITKIFDPQGNAMGLKELFVTADGREMWGRSEGHNRWINRFRWDGDTITTDQFYFDDLSRRYSTNFENLAVVGDHVYVGSSAGIFRSRIDQLKPYGLAPRVNLIKVDVFQDRQPLGPHYELAHDSNFLNLEFEVISYRILAPELRCRMIGLDTAWTTPTYNALQYTNLDPGDYRFEAQARLAGEPWGALYTTTFHIRTPFWQTWWFYLLEGLAALLVIGLAFGVWYRIQRRRTTLLIEKLRAEQRALRAQMNPHFLFNAMSSIQDLVFNENRISAVTNIALFARLMRRILAHSSAQVITLKEEIETLELYLTLEALRFEDRLDYAITVSDDLRPEERMIPPLLIQPFAENAIKHGLLNREPAGGCLRIDFRLNNGALCCTIEDDGVGRQQAAHLRAQRQPDHQSFATQGLEQRIQLLNAERHAGIHFTTIDLIDESGKPNGTRIELTLP